LAIWVMNDELLKKAAKQCDAALGSSMHEVGHGK
jgi:hypothetical protein